MAKRGKKTPADLAEEVLPAIGSAIEDFYDKASPIVKKGRKLAKAKVRQERERAAAALQPAVSAISNAPTPSLKRKPPKKKSRQLLKKLLLLGGLVALGGIVAKKLQGHSGGGNWQSTYTPAPAPKQAVDDVPSDHDFAAASPDEAISDRASEPHPDTDPDDPAEVVELAEPEPEAAAESPYAEGSAKDD